jgi:hypothetical protein
MEDTMTGTEGSVLLVVEIDGDGQFTLEQMRYRERAQTPPSTWTHSQPPTWAQIRFDSLAYPISSGTSLNQDLSYHAEVRIPQIGNRTGLARSGIEIDIVSGLLTITLSAGEGNRVLADRVRPTIVRGENYPQQFSISGVLLEPHVAR